MTLDRLRAFAEGYIHGLGLYNGLIEYTDDWVVWGGFDINLAGAEYSDGLADNEVRVFAYPAGWVDTLPDPAHTFIIKG